MVQIDKLKEIVNNKPVLILLHGASIGKLEDKIFDLKDIDICYASLNNFRVVEPIIEKIGKQLSVVLDCTKVPNTQAFNEQLRIPRLDEFLKRKDNNMWVTTKKLVYTIMFEICNQKFISRNSDKTFVLDSINFDVGRVPNSSVILVGILAIAGAKKIVICGFDGHKPGVPNIETYYKYELQIYSKTLAGDLDVSNFWAESKRIQDEASIFISDYCNQFKIDIPEIVLCSENTTYTMYPRINYGQLKHFLIK